MASKCTLILLILLVPLIGITLHNTLLFLEVPPVPKIENTWWGFGPEKEDTSIKPFKINVPKQVIDDLKRRINNTRPLTPPLEGIQQQYGFNTNTLKPVLDYWLNKYDWPTREKYLNQFPQFKTNIQGLNIHYIHVKPDVPTGTRVLPLLLLHGWPGSVREFYKIIPILSKVHAKYGFAFEVVVPSLPGYGFSDGAVRPGLGTAEISNVLKNLMLRLGHQKFYVQGGDWGAIIITAMATIYPEHLLGLHTNMPMLMGKISTLKLFFYSFCPSLLLEEEYIGRMYPLSQRFSDLLLESGYFHIQATKPDTVGVGINDSPAGLAAYILEKFSTGTNKDYRQREDGGLLEKYTYDELIDNLMFYWVPQSFTTASRIYSEGFSKRQLAFRLNDIPISGDVPCAVARFPNEIAYYPDSMLTDKYTNLVHTSDFKQGGHFAALENPELLGEDVFIAINKMLNLKK